MGRCFGCLPDMKLFAWLCLLSAVAAAASPEVFRVKFETTAGNFVIETHHEWAPHGADRLYQLVGAKYFDDSRFFRVVAGNWAQFGIAGNPKVAYAWRKRTIHPDLHQSGR